MPDAVARADEASLHELIRVWLKQLPAQTANAVRLGAIPQVIEQPVLRALLDDPLQADAVMHELRSLNFVTADRQDQLTYTASVRAVLLADWWATPQTLAAYRQANQHLLPLLESRANQADDPASRQRYALRWAYHTLAADEQTGLALVDELFVRFKVYYQWEAAEQLLARLAELTPILQDTTQQWLDYFAIDLAQARNEPVAARLQIAERLISTSTNDRLRALAYLNHGYARLSQLNWSAAHTDFDASLLYFRAQPDDLKFAEVLLAYTQFYHQLAQNTGDLSQVRFATNAPQTQAWLRRLIDAPFGLFRALLRAWPWAAACYFTVGTRPSRIGLWLTTGYVGINYQDWLVARLLIQAITWGQQAEQESVRLRHTNTLAITQEELAILYYKLGHHRHSAQLIQTLLANPWVRANPYRFAHAVRVQGNIAFIANQFTVAAQACAASLLTFESVEDWAAIAQVSSLYGKVCLRLADYARAIENFARALTAFQHVADDFGRTAVAVDLEHTAEQPNLAPDLRAQASAVFAQIDVFAFVERFPNAIYQRFWQPNVIAGVAVWFTALLLVILSTLLFGGIEADLHLGTLGWNLFSLIGMVAMPFLVIWGFQLLYTLIGSLFYAWLIPLRAFETAQPDIYLVDQEAFTYKKASSAQPARKILWERQPHATSAATFLTGHPLPLLSELTILLPNVRQVVPGTVRYFQRLQRAVAKQTVPSHWRNYDIRLANLGWTIVLLLLCFGLGFMMAYRSKLEIESGLPGGIFTFGFCVEFNASPSQPPDEVSRCFTNPATIVDVPTALIFLNTSLAMLLIFPLEIGLRLLCRQLWVSSILYAIRARRAD